MTPYQHTDRTISKMLMNLSKPHCHESASVFSSSTARNAKPCSKFTKKQSPPEVPQITTIETNPLSAPLDISCCLWPEFWRNSITAAIKTLQLSQLSPLSPLSKKIDAFLTFTFQGSRGTDDGLASHLEFLKNTSKMQCMSCRPNKSEFKLKGHPKVPKDLCLPRSFIIFQGSTSFHTKLRYPHLCGLV